MTGTGGAFGPAPWRSRAPAPITRGPGPRTPATKIKTGLLRPGDVASFRADHEGIVSATRAHVAEDGRLEHA